VRILLDTCTFLWITTDAVELSKNARQIFSNPENEIFLSCVSVWEIMVKNHLGKLPLPDEAEEFITDQRVQHEINQNLQNFSRVGRINAVSSTTTV